MPFYTKFYIILDTVKEFEHYNDRKSDRNKNITTITEKQSETYKQNAIKSLIKTNHGSCATRIDRQSPKWTAVKQFQY